jgi:hypothetical protein
MRTIPLEKGEYPGISAIDRIPQHAHCDVCHEKATHHIVATFETKPKERLFAGPTKHSFIGDACDEHTKGVINAVLTEAKTVREEILFS